MLTLCQIFNCWIFSVSIFWVLCLNVLYYFQALNDKFSGDIGNMKYEIMFPDQYFTCTSRCLSCESRCTGSMGHLKENIPHINNNKCRYMFHFKFFNEIIFFFDLQWILKFANDTMKIIVIDINLFWKWKMELLFCFIFLNLTLI